MPIFATILCFSCLRPPTSYPPEGEAMIALQPIKWSFPFPSAFPLSSSIRGEPKCHVSEQLSFMKPERSEAGVISPRGEVGGGPFLPRLPSPRCSSGFFFLSIKKVISSLDTCIEVLLGRSKQRMIRIHIYSIVTKIGLSLFPRLRDSPPTPRGESRNLGKRL